MVGIEQTDGSASMIESSAGVRKKKAEKVEEMVGKEKVEKERKEGGCSVVKLNVKDLRKIGSEIVLYQKNNGCGDQDGDFDDDNDL